MSEVDSGGGEAFLPGPGELQHVAEGGDLDGAFDAVGSDRRRDGVDDAEHVDPQRNIAVLEVPPHRNPHAARLLLVPPRQGVGPPGEGEGEEEEGAMGPTPSGR